MHALNVLEDVLGDQSAGKAHELRQAMQIIGDEGRGVLVLIREPHPSSLSERLRVLPGGGEQTTGELRDYGVGAQILLDLGVKDMILLSNTKRTIIGLEGYGLTVAGQRPISPDE
jgi:3,4-dihydroxy 2-butanone 4-phosphate synthase/GTP cyclohydrolase II